MNILAQAMTTREIEQRYGLKNGTVYAYTKRHRDRMQESQTLRKSGATWLILRAEAHRIWGHKQRSQSGG